MADRNYEDDYRSGMEDDLAPSDGARKHPFEAELLQPTPRNVRVRFGTKIGRWIWIVLAIGVPTVFAQFGNSSQEKWEALKDHGAETEGRLVGKEARRTGKNGHPPRGTFHYVVEGATHSITIDLSDEEYARAHAGDRRRVIYLPERPDVARMRDELAGGGDYSPQAKVLWGIGAVVGLLLIGLWFYAERVRSRRYHLAAEGIPVATNVLEKQKASRKSSDKNWKVSYSYEFDGQYYQGSGTYAMPVIQKMLVGGINKATVLVDPAQPSRHELYGAVRQAMEIIPAAGPGGFGGE